VPPGDTPTVAVVAVAPAAVVAVTAALAAAVSRVADFVALRRRRRRADPNTGACEDDYGGGDGSQTTDAGYMCTHNVFLSELSN
jgi:hypothetical protein